MKRIFAFLGLFAITGGITLGAQTGLFVGGKLGAGIGVNELEGEIKSLVKEYDLDEESNIAFALDLYGGYAFTDKLSILTGLNFMFNNGVKLSYPGEVIEITVNSLDIPVLLRYKFINHPFVFGLQAGPYLSVPFGLEYNASDGDSGEADVDGVLFGITAGLIAGFPIGPGHIIGDIRFLADLSPIKEKDDGDSYELFTRYGVNVTVGYEFSFGGRRSSPALSSSSSAQNTGRPRDTNTGGIEGAVIRASDSLIADLPLGSTVAVLSISSDDKDAATFVMDELEYKLVDSRRYKMVDRKTLDAIRSERDFQISGEVSDESAVSIGNMLGANIVITGTVSGRGSTRRLTLKALDVKTAEIITMAREQF
jgi:hypothetical protein